MKALLIARRDLTAYLQGYSAYVIIATLLLGNGLFFQFFVLGNDSEHLSTDILAAFFNVCWGFAVTTAILLTMRSVASEHSTGTETLLQTSILQDWHVVTGKWLAAMGVCSLYLALTVHMPALIFVNGRVSWGHLFSGYSGALLGCGVAAALGVFCSALFRHQIAAGIVGGTVAIYMAVLAPFIADQVEPPFGAIVAYTALFNDHYVPFMEGRIPTSSVAFHLLLIITLLTLASQVLNSRRWE